MTINSKNENSPAAAKPYRKPSIVKGPVLTAITAIKTVSGFVPSDGSGS